MSARAVLAAVSLLALTLTLPGCPDADERELPVPPDEAPTEPLEGASPRYDAATATASVSGVVRLLGTPPAARKLAIAGDDFCDAHNDGHDVWDPGLIVNADASLPNAVVWASKGPHRDLAGVPTLGDARVRQVGCMYEPHVFLVGVDKDVVVSNDDQTSHNVHVKSKRLAPRSVIQSPGQHDTFVFTKAETAIPFSCDIHSWMKAWGFASPHAFIAVADEQGRFEIVGLPAGDYEFRVWHETFGKQKIPVSLTQGQAATLDIELDVDAGSD